MAQKQPSWAEKLRISSSASRFSLSGNRCTVSDVVEVPDAILQESSKKWKRCLVGYFAGSNMPFFAVRSCAMRAWADFEIESVQTAGNGFFIFRFQSENNAKEVMERGPWLFGNKHIILQPWHPHFNFDKNKITATPVWIRLYGLPFPLWTEEGLNLVCSRIGRPLSCDKMTYECLRLDYARVCIELDSKEDPIHTFEIRCSLSPQPIKVNVEYEWKPKRCKKCCLFGHICTEFKQEPHPPTTKNAKPPSEAIVNSISSEVPIPKKASKLHYSDSKSSDRGISGAIEASSEPTPLENRFKLLACDNDSVSASISPIEDIQDVLLPDGLCMENKEFPSPPSQLDSRDDSTPKNTKASTSKTSQISPKYYGGKGKAKKLKGTKARWS